MPRAGGGAAAAFGRLDVLVNMASVYKSVPFDETDEHVLEQRRSTWTCAPRSYARGPRFRTCAAAGGGRIINFSDWVAASGRPRYPGYLPYYVAKAGAIALTEALALELRRRQDPRERGRSRPDRRAARHDRGGAARGRGRHAARPLGRARARSSRAVMFLVETDFVTGETIRVDGGRHIK